MQFNYTGPQTNIERLFGSYYHITAIGTIEIGDDEKFRRFLETNEAPPRTTVYIDSVGGNVDAAIAMGRLIRAAWFETSIGQYQLQPYEEDLPTVSREHHAGRCYSAATLIYIGGRLRHFPDGSCFGVHQFSYKDPTPENFESSQLLSAKIARYISDMDIRPDFLEISSSIPSREIKLIDADELRKLNVVTDGQTSAVWSLQAQGSMLYVRGERDSIYGHHKVILAYKKNSGFVFWGVIEAQGREDELTSFALVEIVLNGEDTRIDISERCERLVSGIYVNVFANLSQEEARSIAFSDSFGVQIRFSKDAPLFLGIAAVSTEGGREALETFFKNLEAD